MKPNYFAAPAAIAFGVLLSGPAGAAMSNMPSTYGLLPTDVASAQSLSLFDSQVSAVYYNPAALTHDSRGELTFGFLDAEHDLRASNNGGAAPLTQTNDVVQGKPSHDVLVGMKTNLGSLLDNGHPIYFAFMAGVEKYGQELMAFNSQTSQQGQFLEYGQQPLFLSMGGATNIWRGIDVGAGVRVTLHSDATLIAQSDLAGNTQYQTLNVSAAPSIRPIVGTNINWGKTVCDQACGLDNLETALAWRGSSDSHTNVTSNVVIPGTIPSPGLTINLTTLDSFQPETLTAGFKYHMGRLSVGATGEWQRWSGLNSALANDTIKATGDARFKNIFIPRVGAEYEVVDKLTLTGGVAYEPSSLENSQTLDVNYLDNDKIVLGAGLSKVFGKMSPLAYPIQLDLAYQYQHLQRRDFNLSTSNPASPAVVYESVTAKGHVQVFAASLSMKF